MSGNHGYYINDDAPDMGQGGGGRFYDLRAANVRTANSALARDLKGRHLQMIAIGGSVGMAYRPQRYSEIQRQLITQVF